MSETNERDESLEQYFESMKRLWDNPDFQILVQELSVQSASVNAVEDVSPSASRTAEQDLFFRKGQMNVIRTIQNLSENIAICEDEYHKSLEPEADNSDQSWDM